MTRNGTGSRIGRSLGLLVLSALVAAAHAKELNVPGDPGCQDIQSAILIADNGDEIIVAPGTYAEAINLHGKSVRLRSSDGPAVTIIDGTGLDSSVVTCTSDEKDDTIIEGFTIKGGAGWLMDGQRWGGGMYNAGSAPTVRNCVFSGNVVNYFGGGMSNLYASPTVEDCTFAGNAGRAFGGGMYNEYSRPKVVNCTFSGNTSIDGGGGGMGNFYSSPTVQGCTFVANVAGYGGGGMSNSWGSDATVIDCVFESNLCGFDSTGGAIDNALGAYPLISDCAFFDNTGGYGGAIYNAPVYPPVKGCVFVGNVAVFDGGGIYNGAAERCDFNGNRAWNGGGVYAYVGGALLDTCVFSGNAAGACGGGAFVRFGTATVLDCTFAANQAAPGKGSAIYALANPRVMNSILWGDTPDALAGSAIATHCDIRGGYPGEGNIDADPVFTRPPDAGADGVWGTTDDEYGDVRLTDASPCVDTGDPAVRDGGDEDKDGHRRVWDGDGDGIAIVDMGAYEFGSCCFGDLNADGVVDQSDLGILLGDFGCDGGSCIGDCDGDGDVDQSDLGLLLMHFGHGL